MLGRRALSALTVKQWLWAAEISEAGSLASAGENYAVWLTPQSSFWDQGKATLSSFPWGHLWWLILRVNLTEIRGAQIFVVVVRSVPQSCLTLCSPMDCSTPSFPVFTISWSLLKLMSIELVMPSNHLVLCHPLLPSIFPSITVFSNESALHIRWPKYGNFSFSISSSSEESGLISFRLDWLDLLAVRGTLKSLLQHHNSKALILWCSAFFMVQLTYIWLNILLGVSVRIYPGEIRIWIGRQSKADGPPQCGWASFSLLRNWVEQRKADKETGRESSISVGLLQLGRQSSPVQELGLMPCFQMFGLRLELMPPIPLVLRYSNCNWLFWISCLQAADGGNFSFHYHESMIWGLPCWSSGWESAVHCKGHWFSLCFGKIPYAAEQLSPCAKTTGL